MYALLVLLIRNSYKNYILAALIFPVWWAYYNEDSLLTSIQLLYSGIFPVLTFALLRDEERFKVAQWYIKLFIWLLIIGLPIYLIINLFDIPPLFSIQRGEVGKGRVYDNYLFFYWSRAGVENRFSSVFDEPGVVGTIIPLIMFYYRRMLSRFEFWVLIISGVLSLSLFFLIVFLPVIYFSSTRLLSTKQLAFRIAFSTVFICISYVTFVFAARSTKDDPLLSHRVYNRFEWQNDWIVGVVNNRDTRIRGFESMYQGFIDESDADLYTGRGKDYMLKVYGGSTLSYRVFVLERGILILFYLAFLFAYFHPWRKYFIFSLISMLILMLVFFQRPSLYSINYFVLVYVGLKLFEMQAQNKSEKLDPDNENSPHYSIS
ncbi:hypothetical protein [Dyadobacter fanqingshengii]|uniref:O-antigen ligase domain-containing protein n=1 Tax=Dyadobacter fanqingshengii TaxID=2906443 RepID=A0A9X1P5A2_9BACT|nr:hypothetical protein [Dyadobacter fanqingshengii]MCF0039099.1 hypothetical protein [Dyadobacter fanqingshengii]USJ34080.1 hypothetical protein NFI81_15330 [Dyadobacter fanqingshengii]